MCKENKNEKSEKREKREKILEVLIVIFLGLTAILTAWATWLGALHEGNQATNYTKSNNLASKGTALYNEATQQVMQDMLTWNTIREYAFEIETANMEKDKKKQEMLEEKTKMLIEESCTDQLKDAVNWAIENNKSPFEKEGYLESYFEEAQKAITESEAVLQEGEQDNKNGDTFGLVTVIYSIVLFLLGIIGIFKNLPNRMMVMGLSIVFLVFDFLFMLTIPLPTGFDIGNYLGSFF